MVFTKDLVLPHCDMDRMLQKAASQMLCPHPPRPEWGLGPGVTWCLAFIRTMQWNDNLKELSGNSQQPPVWFCRERPAAARRVEMWKSCITVLHQHLPVSRRTEGNFCPESVFIMTQRFVIG